MRNHFKTFSHWYDLDAIAKSYDVYLPMEKLVDDDEIETHWPSWYDEFLNDPFNTLSAVALAMHTVLAEAMKDKDNEYMHLKKLSVR
jgi:hypothetical protein